MLLKDKHIFIVEDDPRNRAVLITILQRQGALTHFDQWGIQTIDRIKEFQQIDLILLDLMLPRGVSGYDVYDQLQAEPTLAHIPVVIVSASDPALEMNKARKRGLQGYISKPINHLTFAQSIASLLDGNEIWADDFII